MYYRVDTGQIFSTQSEIRSSFMVGELIVMFSENITDDDLASRGVFPMAYNKPAVPLGQIAVASEVRLVDGMWTQQWDVRDATPEEIKEQEGKELTALISAKQAKIDQINQWRAQANQSTFPYQGKLIACDQLSRSDIDGVAGMISLTGAFPGGFPGAWKAVDNTYIVLKDADAFKAMYTAMAAQGAINFNHAQEMKAQVAAATTAEDIAKIVW